MNFKDLTEEIINQARVIYTDKNKTWDDRMNELVQLFGVSERTARRWCSTKLGFKEKPEIEPEQYVKAKQKEHNKEKKRFLITSAQSATPVNKEFLKNLEAYAEHIDAEILVIPFRYKNPTSVFTNKQEEMEWWDDKVIQYLTLNRHDLNNAVSVLSDIKIQPTASAPLTGLEGITGDHSCVVGHPRIELKTIPVMRGSRPKIMFTTGACTIPNYTDAKAGVKGSFHHSIGFSIVEIKDEETFFFRQVSATDKGEFIDLFYHVKNGIVSKETEVEAIAMGDIHVAHCDPKVTDITLNNLFTKLYPKKIFIHDIIDSESISHHNMKDPFILHEQEMDGSNSLQKEIDDMIDWLKQIKDYNVYIVRSNHDEHIERFLAENDWRKLTTLKNAIPYMELAMARLKGEAKKGVIPYIINKHYPKINCLTDDDYVMVKGYLMSVHGHLGASGSRGSLAQYSRLSTKSVTGHSHQIGRIGGAVSVGTSTHLKLRYTKGASAWINAHGIVNRLGKFQHIVFFHTKDGLEYTTLV